MSWQKDPVVYIDECTKVWEGCKFSDNPDGSTTLTFKNGASIVMGPIDAVAGSGKILLICDSIPSANYLPEIEKQKELVMRIFKVKCGSCKGNYIIKDHNSIFLTKCKLCGSHKVDYDR